MIATTQRSAIDHVASRHVDGAVAEVCRREVLPARGLILGYAVGQKALPFDSLDPRGVGVLYANDADHGVRSARVQEHDCLVDVESGAKRRRRLERCDGVVA